MRKLLVPHSRYIKRQILRNIVGRHIILAQTF